MAAVRSRMLPLRTSHWCLLAWLSMGQALAEPAYDFSDVERIAAAAVAKGSVPSLAVAIAKDGKIVYERAFGLADVESRIPATTRTAYPLASATKPITATALMVLHEQAGFNLSAPVETYLPDLRFRTASGETQPVSTLQLLSHTSGLGTYARILYGDAIPGPPLDAELRRFGRLLHEPGRVAEYSNLGYGVVGQLIERHSRKALSDFVEEAVFHPLGMNDSFMGRPGGRQVTVAAGYDAASARLPALFNNTPGAGNAYASVHDLVRFGMFHLQPDQAARPVLARGNVERMRANAVPLALHHYYGAAAYYGLGWYVRPDVGGQRVVWHEGGMPGASTIIMLLPEQDIVVAVLGNRSDANDLTQDVADRLIRTVLPEYRATPLNPVAAYMPYAGQAGFPGRWAGRITVDGVELDCVLTLDADGNGSIRHADASGKQIEASLRAMVYDDSLISAFPGRLPVADIAPGDQPLLLLKLLRTGNRLAGSIVAYSSPARLEYLLPFAIVLERETGL